MIINKNIKQLKLILLWLCVGVVSVFGLAGCGLFYEDYSASGVLMGTIFTAGFRAEGAGSGEAVWTKLSEEGIGLEQELISRRLDSAEIYALNASAGCEEGFAISEELENYLLYCLELSEQTDGAFDITVGALSVLWGIDEAAAGEAEFVLPDCRTIEEMKAYCGYGKLKIENHRAYMPEGMIIDLGAVGKGIYLDRSKEILGDMCTYGILAAGGSILTYGYRSGGIPWRVGIADPDGKTKVIDTLALDGDYFVSTSGNYERYAEYDGVRYHHIIDPRTGYPAASGLQAVTVVLEGNIPQGGFLSDALTTAIFVLGEENGMKLAEKYGAAVFLILDDGVVVTNEAMKKYLVQ